MRRPSLEKLSKLPKVTQVKVKKPRCNCRSTWLRNLCFVSMATHLSSDSSVPLNSHSTMTYWYPLLLLKTVSPIHMRGLIFSKNKKVKYGQDQSNLFPKQNFDVALGKNQRRKERFFCPSLSEIPYYLNKMSLNTLSTFRSLEKVWFYMGLSLANLLEKKYLNKCLNLKSTCFSLIASA